MYHYLHTTTIISHMDYCNGLLTGLCALILTPQVQPQHSNQSNTLKSKLDYHFAAQNPLIALHFPSKGGQEFLQ